MKKTTFDIIAILSTLGILLWILSDFHGGMMLHLLVYGLIIIPVVLLYVISAIETIVSTCKNGIKTNKIKLIAHLTTFLAIILFNTYELDLIHSKKVLTATLKDDQFHYTLIFRENGNCENKISGMLGYTETIKGKYRFVGDTVVFGIKPYHKEFLPDTLLIDRNQNAIFITRETGGNFATTKDWLNHFEIH